MAEQVKEKVDIKVIEAKLDKNEKLTADEEKFLLEQEPAPSDFGGNPGPQTEEKKESAAEESAEDKTAREQEEKDRKAKDALIGRAKAAGLSETATEDEVIADEKKKVVDDDSKDPLVKIETLLQENQDKPDDQVDLSKIDLTPREKAYFWQMRRDRKARQQAEADRDAARFEALKLKKEKPADEPKDKKEEEDDPLKGKDPTDFLTVADVQKILAKSQKKEEPKGSDSIMALPFVQSFIKKCDAEAAAEKPDYAEVLELTPEIINTNPAYQKQVAEAFVRGDNPALKMYELIKADPEFAKLFPAAQTRVKARGAKKSEEKKEEPKAKTPEELKKEEEAKEAEERLKNNASKDKTSGHLDSKDKFEGTEYSLEQIAAMTDREFSKLPKKAREKYLEMYG